MVVLLGLGCIAEKSSRSIELKVREEVKAAAGVKVECIIFSVFFAVALNLSFFSRPIVPGFDAF